MLITSTKYTPVLIFSDRTLNRQWVGFIQRSWFYITSGSGGTVAEIQSVQNISAMKRSTGRYLSKTVLKWNFFKVLEHKIKAINIILNGRSSFIILLKLINLYQLKSSLVLQLVHLNRLWLEIIPEFRVRFCDSSHKTDTSCRVWGDPLELDTTDSRSIDFLVRNGVLKTNQGEFSSLPYSTIAFELTPACLHCITWLLTVSSTLNSPWEPFSFRAWNMKPVNTLAVLLPPLSVTLTGIPPWTIFASTFKE